MGRGGPREPELVETQPERRRPARALAHRTPCRLRPSRDGGALPASSTIGCRRAGGGLAGAVFDSNVAAGAELARSLEPDVVVFDGSGAAIPPVATSARILVTTAGARPRRVSESVPRRDLGSRRRHRRRPRRRRPRRACACAQMQPLRRAAAPPSSRRAPRPVEHLDAEHRPRLPQPREPRRVARRARGESTRTSTSSSSRPRRSTSSPRRPQRAASSSSSPRTTSTGDGLDEAVLVASARSRCRREQARDPADRRRDRHR